MKRPVIRCASVAAALFSLAPVVAGQLPGDLTNRDPTTWWPDPNTGLMWAGQPHTNPNRAPGKGWGLSWPDATAYCSSLKLDGLTGWRLPALDEVKAATVASKIDYSFWSPGEGEVHVAIDGTFFKGRSDGPPTNSPYLFWTSTMSGTQAAWYALMNARGKPFKTGSIESNRLPSALCVHPMDPDVAALAKEANVDVPIATLQDMQAFIALGKARANYHAAQYSASLQQAQAALALRPNFLPALVGIGLSSGMLGQWDQAVSSLQTVDKLGGNTVVTAAELKWAKSGQKAAAKGKKPKSAPAPAWI